MTPRRLILDASRRLTAAGVPDARLDAALLLSHLTGRDQLSLRLDDDTRLDADTRSRFEALVNRRAEREPLQYLTGEADFLGRVFHVDKRVLIPRPETAWMCERTLSLTLPSSAPVILDLCSGSGCLGITLALEKPGAEVHLSDLSEDALAVAALNAEALEAAVTFHRGDLFDPVDDLCFDLIVSNPPYIPQAECRVLQQEVMR